MTSEVNSKNRGVLGAIARWTFGAGLRPEVAGGQREVAVPAIVAHHPDIHFPPHHTSHVCSYLLPQALKRTFETLAKQGVQ